MRTPTGYPYDYPSTSARILAALASIPVVAVDRRRGVLVARVDAPRETPRPRWAGRRYRRGPGNQHTPVGYRWTRRRRPGRFRRA